MLELKHSSTQGAVAMIFDELLVPWRFDLFKVLNLGGAHSFLLKGARRRPGVESKRQR